MASWERVRDCPPLALRNSFMKPPMARGISKVQNNITTACKGSTKIPIKTNSTIGAVKEALTWGKNHWEYSAYFSAPLVAKVIILPVDSGLTRAGPALKTEARMRERNWVSSRTRPRASVLTSKNLATNITIVASIPSTNQE